VAIAIPDQGFVFCLHVMPRVLPSFLHVVFLSTHCSVKVHGVVTYAMHMSCNNPQLIKYRALLSPIGQITYTCTLQGKF
jgi:hypothetical protein